MKMTNTEKELPSVVTFSKKKKKKKIIIGPSGDRTQDLRVISTTL